MSLPLTHDNRTRLRELIDEVIPIGRMAQDTRMTDVQVDSLLVAAVDMHSAAAAGWRLKATWAMSERGGLQESKAGDEQHKFISLEAYRDHCLAMAKMYSNMSLSSGTRLLKYDFEVKTE